jgi:glycosyltransferase involved in cell wall biosynthesis
LNILFILPEYYPHSGGGISSYYLHYINALKPHCKRVKVIVGSGYVQGDEKLTHNGIEVEYLDPLLYKEQLKKFTKLDLLPEYRNNIAAAWAMWQQSNSGEGFDIIECTDFGLGFIPWVIHHNKPVITRMHGSAGQIALHENNSDTGLSIDANMQAELALLPFCDRILTHSTANRNFWTPILPSANIHYIKPIYTSAINTPILFADRDNNGLVTARIQKWKGPAELCKAIHLLKIDINIKWFGRDMPYDNTQSTNEYLSTAYPGIWNNKIIPHPPKPNTEIQTMQGHAKFGIVPSVWDMFNFTCVEFMAAGTPVICADGAGASDLIEHGVNGYKYAANDLEELAECISSLISLDRDNYHKMAVAGQQTISNLLSSDALITTYIEQYKTVMTEFASSEANVFLSNVYSPSDVEHSFADVLNKQPLRKLMNYIKKRILRKIKKK